MSNKSKVCADRSRAKIDQLLVCRSARPGGKKPLNITDGGTPGPKARGRPGRKAREDSPQLREIAKRTYVLHMFHQLPLHTAYFGAHPGKKGKIKKATAKRLALLECQFVETYLQDEIQQMLHQFNLTAARLANGIEQGLKAERAIVLHKTDKQGRLQEELVHVPEWPARLGYIELLKELVAPDQAPIGGNTFVFEIDSRIKVPDTSGLSKPSPAKRKEDLR